MLSSINAAVPKLLRLMAPLTYWPMATALLIYNPIGQQVFFLRIQWLPCLVSVVPVWEPLHQCVGIRMQWHLHNSGGQCPAQSLETIYPSHSVVLSGGVVLNYFLLLTLSPSTHQRRKMCSVRAPCLQAHPHHPAFKENSSWILCS